MTIALLKAQTPRKYTGLSTDTKPILGPNDTSAYFYETDKRKLFEWWFDDWVYTPYIDKYSGAVGVIDQEHLKIHDGDGYTIGRRFTISNGGGTKTFLGIVPVGIFPHFRTMSISIDGGPFDIDFYEATTTSFNGTLVTSYNNNRNSTNTASLLIYDAPTITTVGTLLEPVLVPSTKQAGAIGTDASNEWILKQDTKYMIRVTNNKSGAGTSNAAINMFWYE